MHNMMLRLHSIRRPYTNSLFDKSWYPRKEKSLIGLAGFKFDNRGASVDVEFLKEFVNLISIYWQTQMENSIANKAIKLGALGEMAVGLAHEINNPIAIIHGQSQILKIQMSSLSSEEWESNKDEIVKGLNEISDTAERMDKIVTGLRYFIKNDKNDPFQNTEAKEIMGHVQVLVAGNLRKNKVNLSWDSQEEEIGLHGKPMQVAQAIINLINNSIDAIKNKDEKWIKVKFIKEENNRVTITVTDSGEGISKDLERRILQPFYTTKKVSASGGLGVGLSIAKRIIDTHQGKLYIDHNCPNTRFVMNLPGAKD